VEDTLQILNEDAIELFADHGDEVDTNDEVSDDEGQRSNSNDEEQRRAHINDNEGEQKSEHDVDAGHSTTRAKGRYNVRESHQQSYTHTFNQAMDNPASMKSYDFQTLQRAAEEMTNEETPIKVQRNVTAFIMTQMMATAGIKKQQKPC